MSDDSPYNDSQYSPDEIEQQIRDLAKRFADLPWLTEPGESVDETKPMTGIIEVDEEMADRIRAILADEAEATALMQILAEQNTYIEVDDDH